MVEQFNPTQAFSDIVRSLADEPSTVKVEITTGADRSTTLHVTTAPGEVGRLIGINGRTARALRVLLQAVGNARGERYVLDIKEG